jgi:hypothetical protein
MESLCRQFSSLFLESFRSIQGVHAEAAFDDNAIALVVVGLNFLRQVAPANDLECRRRIIGP